MFQMVKNTKGKIFRLVLQGMCVQPGMYLSVLRR